MHHHNDCGHGGSTGVIPNSTSTIALLGNPNAGKTSVFNMVTGLRAKTGNYPGVTVSRMIGQIPRTSIVVEDLPGTYSLDPISPDERVVTDVLGGKLTENPPEAIVVVVDATMLRRGLGLVAESLRLGLPTSVIVTMTDELLRRGGRLDISALSRSLGVPVVPVIANRGRGVAEAKELFEHSQHWDQPEMLPPSHPEAEAAWIESILDTAQYRQARPDGPTARIDAILLHPVWGMVAFFVIMFLFFQIIFTVAAPLQSLVGDGFSWLSDVVTAVFGDSWISALLGNAVIGGVGTVLTFLPQIMLMFLLIALLEGVGYMARAAFLMDRVMSVGGLEGRAFVAMLSSFACAVPGIMATRTLPNEKDRIATILAAPLITCSARLPVYVLLVGMLVDPTDRIGPFTMQGAIMFALYVLGGTCAMIAASIAKRLQGSRDQLPFYMELPPYRLPTAISVVSSMWVSGRTFVRKCGTIILATSIVLWLLLNLPIVSAAELEQAGIDATDSGAVATYTMDQSAAAWVGKAVEPVFEPLGFDWRINIGIIASLSARETFVATLGQISSADDPDDPSDALAQMTYLDGPNAGQPIFTPATIIAIIVFFAFALQCMSTVSVMRRETGSWKWPAIAFTYMFILAWCGAFIAHSIALILGGGAS